MATVDNRETAKAQGKPWWLVLACLVVLVLWRTVLEGRVGYYLIVSNIGAALVPTAVSALIVILVKQPTIAKVAVIIVTLFFMGVSWNALRG